VKQTRTKNKISGHVIRSAAYAVSLPFAFIALSSAFNSPNRWQESGWVIRARETMRGLPNGVHEVKSPVAFVFTVTNTDDTGPGSLREAILDSNANPGPPGTTNLIKRGAAIRVEGLADRGSHTYLLREVAYAMPPKPPLP